MDKTVCYKTASSNKSRSNVEEGEVGDTVARISVFCALLCFDSFLAANLFFSNLGSGGANNPASSVAAQLQAFKKQSSSTTFSTSSSSFRTPPTIKRDTSQPLIVSLRWKMVWTSIPCFTSSNGTLLTKTRP
jgi:hypothetical protein